MRSFVLTAAVCSLFALLAVGCGGEEPAGSDGGQASDPHAGHENAAHDHADHADHAAKTAADQGGDLANKASALLEAVTKHINENKLDLAEKALAELDKMRADLPESLHKKIDAAHAALDAAKAAGGIEMPKLGE